MARRIQQQFNLPSHQSPSSPGLLREPTVNNGPSFSHVTTGPDYNRKLLAMSQWNNEDYYRFMARDQNRQEFQRQLAASAVAQNAKPTSPAGFSRNLEEPRLIHSQQQSPRNRELMQEIERLRNARNQTAVNYAQGFSTEVQNLEATNLSPSNVREMSLPFGSRPESVSNARAYGQAHHPVGSTSKTLYVLSEVNDMAESKINNRSLQEAKDMLLRAERTFSLLQTQRMISGETSFEDGELKKARFRTYSLISQCFGGLGDTHQAISYLMKANEVALAVLNSEKEKRTIAGLSPNRWILRAVVETQFELCSALLSLRNFQDCEQFVTQALYYCNWCIGTVRGIILNKLEKMADAHRDCFSTMDLDSTLQVLFELLRTLIQLKKMGGIVCEFQQRTEEALWYYSSAAAVLEGSFSQSWPDHFISQELKEEFENYRNFFGLVSHLCRALGPTFRFEPAQAFQQKLAKLFQDLEKGQRALQMRTRVQMSMDRPHLPLTVHSSFMQSLLRAIDEQHRCEQRRVKLTSDREDRPPLTFTQKHQVLSNREDPDGSLSPNANSFPQMTTHPFSEEYSPSVNPILPPKVSPSQAEIGVQARFGSIIKATRIYKDSDTQTALETPIWRPDKVFEESPKDPLAAGPEIEASEVPYQITKKKSRKKSEQTPSKKIEQLSKPDQAVSPAKEKTKVKVKRNTGMPFSSELISNARISKRGSRAIELPGATFLQKVSRQREEREKQSEQQELEEKHPTSPHSLRGAPNNEPESSRSSYPLVENPVELDKYQALKESSKIPIPKQRISEACPIQEAEKVVLFNSSTSEEEEEDILGAMPEAIAPKKARVTGIPNIGKFKEYESEKRRQEKAMQEQEVEKGEGFDHASYFSALINEKEAKIASSGWLSPEAKAKLQTSCLVLMDLRVMYCDNDHPDFDEYERAWKQASSQSQKATSSSTSKGKKPKAKGFISSKNQEEQSQPLKGKAVSFDPKVMQGLTLSKRGSRAVPIDASQLLLKVKKKPDEKHSKPTSPPVAVESDDKESSCPKPHPTSPTNEPTSPPNQTMPPEEFEAMKKKLMAQIALKMKTFFKGRSKKEIVSSMLTQKEVSSGGIPRSSVGGQQQMGFKFNKGKDSDVKKEIEVLKYLKAEEEQDQ